MRSESPFVTRPETTYKSGKVVQTNETTSGVEHPDALLRIRGALTKPTGFVRELVDALRVSGDVEIGVNLFCEGQRRETDVELMFGQGQLPLDVGREVSIVSSSAQARDHEKRQGAAAD